MDRRALLLGLLFAPFAAVAKPDGLAKPVVFGRVYNLPLRLAPGVYPVSEPVLYRYISDEVVF